MTSIPEQSLIVIVFLVRIVRIYIHKNCVVFHIPLDSRIKPYFSASYFVNC